MELYDLDTIEAYARGWEQRLVKKLFIFLTFDYYNPHIFKEGYKSVVTKNEYNMVNLCEKHREYLKVDSSGMHKAFRLTKEKYLTDENFKIKCDYFKSLLTIS